jgi:hypothetical protein
MAKIHFSLPDKVLAWLEKQAKNRGMKRSQCLTYLLTRLMDAEHEPNSER